jgi:transcriptional regulator with XRE-family HTH domain
VSVSALAKALNISTSAVYQWHAGGAITFANLNRVAKVLKVNPSLLLDGPGLPALAEEQDPAAE